MIIAQSGAKLSYERGCFTPTQNVHMCSFENYLCNQLINLIHSMDIIYSELYFGLILVVTIFFFQFLSNNYKHNKNSYTIIIMNKMYITRKTSDR